MTTFLSEQSNPRLPRPDRYTAFLDRLAADVERAAKERRKERIIFWLTVACWASVATVLVVVAWREFA